MDYAGPSELWIGYLVSKAVGMSLTACLRSVTVLAIPSVAYDAQPEGLLRGWQRVHPVRWRLFFTFWLVEAAVIFSPAAFTTLAPYAIDFTPLIDGVAAWSKLDARYIGVTVEGPFKPDHYRY